MVVHNDFLFNNYSSQRFFLRQTQTTHKDFRSTILTVHTMISIRKLYDSQWYSLSKLMVFCLWQLFFFLNSEFCWKIIRKKVGGVGVYFRFENRVYRREPIYFSCYRIYSMGTCGWYERKHELDLLVGVCTQPHQPYISIVGKAVPEYGGRHQQRPIQNQTTQPSTNACWDLQTWRDSGSQWEKRS